MKILIIGGGNMGLTYAKSFLRSKITTTSDLMILEKSEEKANLLEAMNLGTVYTKPDTCLHQADLIILAVKPQDAAQLFAYIKPQVDDQQVYLSIMAGMKIETIAKELGAKKIIRAMPNLPAQIGMGMTVFTSNDDVTRIELVMVQNLINTTGKSIYVDKEELIDASTAISGSGPAYVFFFMDAMMKAAKELGFKESESALLVSQTFKGAVDLYNKHNFSCEDWIQKVASRGGTTEAAINTFTNLELQKDIKQGVHAAMDRAVALGKRDKDKSE